jgi:hypothetical protein
MANLKPQIDCVASRIYIKQENVETWVEEMRAC